MHIIKHLDAILSAYDLRTAKNMRRIQHGEQPKLDGFGEDKLENYNQVVNMENHSYFRIDDYLYSQLEQIEPMLTILDQFKFSRLKNMHTKFMSEIKDKIARIQKQIDDLEAKLYKLREKEGRIYKSIVEKYYKRKYKGLKLDYSDMHKMKETLKAIHFANWLNNEIKDLINSGQLEAGEAMDRVENMWSKISREDDERVSKELHASKIFQDFYSRYSTIMGDMEAKINSLRRSYSQMLADERDADEDFRMAVRDEQINIQAWPKFNVKDTSEAYSQLFEDFPANKTKQRIYPTELMFNLSDYKDEFDKSEFAHSWFYDTDMSGSIDWNKKAMIVISRAAYDIVGRDTNRMYTPSHDPTNIKSHSNNSNQAILPIVVQKGFMIAYLCYADDKNISNPLGAIFISPHLPYKIDYPDSEILNGYNILTAEFVSGFFPNELVSKLQDFLNKNWNSKHHREIGKLYHNPDFKFAGEFFNWKRLYNVGYDEDEGIVDPTTWRYRESRNIPLDYNEKA